jgi:hypothetical protein
MGENKLIETADLLTEEDEKLLAQIQYIKQNILNFIKPQEMVDKIKEIIESSSLFDFKSKRNSKYISTTKPLFILTLDKALAESSKKYNFSYKDGEDVDGRKELVSDYNFINECIHQEITSKYSDFLIKKLTDDDEFINVLNENNIDGEGITREQLRIISFVTSAIFGVTIELRQNIIYLEYVI